MAKIIRNTLFTIAVIGLTAVGLHWNQQVNSSQVSTLVNQTLLSAQNASAANAPDFPLKIEINNQPEILGEPQSVFITTIPGAAVDVVTVYPDSSTNHSQTFHAEANANGQVSFGWTINNFEQLGTFRVAVTASYEGDIAQASKQFQVVSWQPGILTSTPIKP